MSLTTESSTHDYLENVSSFPHVFVAGALGGGVADFAMHSVDTVKTRQQGASHILKYTNIGQAFRTIYFEEGIYRGLYAGLSPAMLGSLPATGLFFLSYESTKRALFSHFDNMPDTLVHLISGFLGDFMASSFYVPAEVLKTRLQLQGRYNNPYFQSGTNYRGVWHAFQTILRQNGVSTLYSGYKATMLRDLPFSALQLAFYEKAKSLQKGSDLSAPMTLFFELLNGSLAGAFAGFLTTPLDVIKTRIQTQVSQKDDIPRSSSIRVQTELTLQPRLALIDSSNIFKNIRNIYKADGFNGLFRGWVPRIAWTAAQSSILFVVYESVLRLLDIDAIR